MELRNPHPKALLRWEWWLLAFLVALCLVLAVAGKGRKQARVYQGFLDRAPVIQEALEAYARDHQGRYPPDAMSIRRPPGLGDGYIVWRESWFIDYDAHPNGRGGYYVCLEFVGPRGEPQYYGLCNDPLKRKRYGRGQPIPGQTNRIWLVREDARVMPPAPEGRR